MKNYPLFQTDAYFGVDHDAVALDRGLERFPQARAVLSRIEEADIPPADFAMCINVFYGSGFDGSDPVEVLQAIIDRMKRGGTLLISLQSKNGVDALLARLNGSFWQTDIFANRLPNRPRSLFALPRAAYRLYVRTYVTDAVWYYCRCLGRL